MPRLREALAASIAATSFPAMLRTAFAEFKKASHTPFT
jgi:hypothetical protein